MNWAEFFGDDTWNEAAQEMLAAGLDILVERGALRIEYRKMYDYRILSSEPDGADALRLVSEWRPVQETLPRPTMPTEDVEGDLLFGPGIEGTFVDGEWRIASNVRPVQETENR